MNPWITNSLLLLISSHKLRVVAREARQWARLRFISVVCVLYKYTERWVGNVSFDLINSNCCVLSIAIFHWKECVTNGDRIQTVAFEPVGD